jgi:phospholipid-transporting ATPase
VLNNSTNQFEEKPWKEVRVGSIVKVLGNEFFPADLVLLSSSGRKGICYIETKNLDGETNLKHKTSNKDIMGLVPDEAAMSQFRAVVKCEGPSDKIYQFDGIITIESYNNEKISLSYDNFLLRGSSLRQTDWVVGLVTFTGHHTRIMKNSTGARTKFSRIEKQTNIQILFIFGLQCLLCLIAMVMGTFWRRQYSETMPYLALTDTFA